MTTTLPWDGILMPREAYGPAAVKARDSLTDAAAQGDWRRALSQVRNDYTVGVNTWKIGGESMFTPLHHAAYLGAPRETVQELLSLGGVRSLPTAHGETPYQLAKRRGHDHLLDMLDPYFRPGTPLGDNLENVNLHVNTTLAELTAEFRGEHQLRTFDVRLISEEGGPDEAWFTAPGMYGGIRIGMFWGRAHLEYNSRMGDSYAVVGPEGSAYVSRSKRALPALPAR
jgi:hypothetical protein